MTYAVAKKNLHEWFGAPPVVLRGERVEVVDRFQGPHEAMLRVKTKTGATGDWTVHCFRKDTPA